MTGAPDKPEEVAAWLASAGLNMEKQFKIKFTVIFAERKGVIT